MELNTIIILKVGGWMGRPRLARGVGGGQQLWEVAQNNDALTPANVIGDGRPKISFWRHYFAVYFGGKISSLIAKTKGQISQKLKEMNHKSKHT